MNNQIYQSSKCNPILPNNFGWLEYQLGQEELDYLWKCVSNKKNDITNTLAGNIESSFSLIDKDNWFLDNILINLVEKYESYFGLTNLATMNYSSMVGNKEMIVPSKHEIYLQKWWVNYQNKYEFNPLHKHSGIYSFVIWLKIPTSHLKENEHNVSNTKVKGDFGFQLMNTLGEMEAYSYDMDSSWEGKMLFFPSPMHHEVYPFYTSDEQRISIAGNVSRMLKLDDDPPPHLNKEQPNKEQNEEYKKWNSDSRGYEHNVGGFDPVQNDKERYFSNGKISINLKIIEE